MQMVNTSDTGSRSSLCAGDVESRPEDGKV